MPRARDGAMGSYRLIGTELLFGLMKVLETASGDDCPTDEVEMASRPTL